MRRVLGIEPRLRGAPLGTLVVDCCQYRVFLGVQAMRTREEWNAWYAKANPWGTAGSIDDEVRVEALVRRLRHAKFRLGLDLGCGEGRLTHVLAQFCDRIVGYDISDTAVQRARVQFPHIEFGTGDLLEVVARPEILVSPFDFVAAAETLYYLQTDAEREEAVSGLARLGAPSCLFFVSVIVNSTSRFRRYFSHDEIVALLSRHFIVIDAFACLAQDTPGLRAARALCPTRELRRRLTAAWTALQAPQDCKHAGYFALKRSNAASDAH